jgi:hypothetical protein
MATSQKYPLDKANKEIRRFLKIQDDINKPELLNQMPEEARTYLSSNKISFVVYKHELDDMFAAAGDANAFRIYLGAKVESNERSLVIFACKVDAYDENQVKNNLPSSRDPATEHTLLQSTSMDKDNFDASKE